MMTNFVVVVVVETLEIVVVVHKVYNYKGLNSDDVKWWWCSSNYDDNLVVVVVDDDEVGVSRNSRIRYPWTPHHQYYYHHQDPYPRPHPLLPFRPNQILLYSNLYPNDER